MVIKLSCLSMFASIFVTALALSRPTWSFAPSLKTPPSSSVKNCRHAPLTRRSAAVFPYVFCDGMVPCGALGLVPYLLACGLGLPARARRPWRKRKPVRSRGNRDVCVFAFSGVVCLLAPFESRLARHNEVCVFFHL